MTMLRQTTLAIILVLTPLAARAADAPDTPGDYDVCVGLVDSDAAKALQYAQGWKAKAVGDVRLAALHCEALALTALGRDDEAAARFDDVANGLVTAPNEAQADALAQAANAWFIAGDIKKARDAMDRAIILQRTPEHLMERARLKALAKDWEGVRKDTGEVLAELPSDANALALRAEAAVELGYPKAALDDAERAVSAGPHNLEALLARGRARAAVGNVAGARDDWRDLIRFAEATGHQRDPAVAAAKEYLTTSGAP